METTEDIPVNLAHHIKNELCMTRPAYRQGRKLTSVKVYTINHESKHLLIYNVPAIGLEIELHNLCLRFGEVLNCKQVPSAENVEEFTNVFHIHYANLKGSRFAKKNIDNRSFFGGVLHVCYAPELETVEETKDKLITRRKEVSFHLKQLEFPKQFRHEGKNRGKKRKFNEISSSGQVDSVRQYQNYYLSQVNQTAEEPPSPGPSKVKTPETKLLDMKPFQKLIPTKVSRIVFHNKTKDKGKTEAVNSMTN